MIDHPAAALLRRVPRRVPVRRIVGRVHLWVALCLGLYVVVLSITGFFLWWTRTRRAGAQNR